MSEKVTVCRLPYQDHYFVHMGDSGHDVWLRRNGTWSPIDGDPDCALPSPSIDQMLKDAHASGKLAADAKLVEAGKAIMKRVAEASKALPGKHDILRDPSGMVTIDCKLLVALRTALRDAGVSE